MSTKIWGHFREIALHTAIKVQIIIIRLVLDLLAVHYHYYCWELDLIFALYMLFVFKSHTVALAMLAIWTLSHITHLNRGPLRIEVIMLEIVLLCCLAFEKQKSDEHVNLKQQSKGAKALGDPASLELPDPSGGAPKGQNNRADWMLLDRYPRQLQDKPTYYFILQEITEGRCLGDIPPSTIENFLCSISNTYNNLPYHNITHAVDVAYTVFIFLTNFGMRKYLELTDLEYGSMLVAAYCHDVGHEGYRNSYYGKIRHRLARAYYDRSVMENFHCSVVFELARRKDCEIFGNLSKEAFAHAKKLIINVILGTDMEFHHDNLEKLKDVVQNRVYLSHLSQTSREIIAKELLHAADINGPSKSFEISEIWKERIAQQFYVEDSKLAAMGLGNAPSPIDMATLNAGQIKFIDALCLPLYTELKAIDPRFQEFIENLSSNRRRYEKMLRQLRESRSIRPT